MLKPISVRTAVPGDAAAVAGLLEDLGYPSHLEHARDAIARLAFTDNDRVFVAEYGTQVAGVVSVHRIPLLHAPGYLARITALVVAPPLRGSGVGRVLMAAAEKFAWASDCIRIEVTSGDHRPEAHTFYERLGYQVDERRFIKRRG